MAVLITGGSGFIGRHLARALAGRGQWPVELGYRPEVTLTWGLERTREWMVRARREAP